MALKSPTLPNIHDAESSLPFQLCHCDLITYAIKLPILVLYMLHFIALPLAGSSQNILCELNTGVFAALAQRYFNFPAIIVFQPRKILR